MRLVTGLRALLYYKVKLSSAIHIVYFFVLYRLHFFMLLLLYVTMFVSFCDVVYTCCHLCMLRKYLMIAIFMHSYILLDLIFY